MINWCLMLDHLQRPQTAFELQKALLKDIPSTTFTEDSDVEVPVDTAEDAEPSFAGRWRARLNRKIF